MLEVKKTHSNHHHQKAPNKWAYKIDQQTATTTSLLEKFPTASHIQPSSSCRRASCASRCSAQLLMRTNAFTDDLTTEQSHGHPAFCMPLAEEISATACEESIFCWESDRPGFTSDHYTRFLGLGVSSVEMEFRELISNCDDPPIYLRIRILAETGTWLRVKNLLGISQCFWEPQILAEHTQSSYRQRYLLATVSGKIIPIFLYFFFKVYHTCTSLWFLKTICKLPSAQNLHGLRNPYYHDLKLGASF